MSSHLSSLKQERNGSQALAPSLQESGDLQTTMPLVTQRMTGARLLSLIAVNALVTLGMLISLLYLSWSGQMEGARPTDVLRSHLPALENIGASLSTHLPLVAGLVAVFIFLALYGARASTAGRRFFTQSAKQIPVQRIADEDRALEQEWDLSGQLTTERHMQKGMHYPSIPLSPRNVPRSSNDWEGASRRQPERSYGSSGPLQSNEPTSPQVFAEIALMQIYAQTLLVPIEQVKGTTHFFEHGGDSEMLQALLKAVAQRLHVTLHPDEVFDHPVVYRLAAVITRKQYKGRGQHDELQPSAPYREEVYA